MYKKCLFKELKIFTCLLQEYFNHFNQFIFIKNVLGKMTCNSLHQIIDESSIIDGEDGVDLDKSEKSMVIIKGQ